MELVESNIKQLTKEILQLKKATIENMFEIGRRLIEIKRSLPHGKFGEYLKEEVDFTQQTANKYMRVCSDFSNYTTLRNLEPSKLVILLDVPKDSVDDFTKENDLENMSCRQIREKIKNLKKEIKKNKKIEKEENINEEEIINKKTEENNESNYDDDGSYNPFKNFKDKAYEQFFKDFNFDNFKPKTLLLDMSPEEKKTLRKFYSILARQVHPDKGGSEEEMKVLNKIKEGWEI